MELMEPSLHLTLSLNNNTIGRGDGAEKKFLSVRIRQLYMRIVRSRLGKDFFNRTAKLKLLNRPATFNLIYGDSMGYKCDVQAYETELHALALPRCSVIKSAGESEGDKGGKNARRTNPPLNPLFPPSLSSYEAKEGI